MSEANAAPGDVATGERQPGLVDVKTARRARDRALAQRVDRYGWEARVILLEPF